MSTAQPYDFLCQPPLTKKRPDVSAFPTDTVSARTTENPRHRSATVTSINSWAASVQPGPPAPLSPSRLDFSSSESHRAARRKSHSAVPMPAPPSPVAYLPEQDDSPTSTSHTITPTLNAKTDLPSVGYTSIFVTLPPKTPPPEVTPDRRRSMTVTRSALPPVPPSPGPTGGAGKGFLRSLTSKHSRSKSTTEGASSGSKSKSSSANPTKDKKSKYADNRPAPLATELALAQFMGGGTIEHHMKQYAKKQAKASGAASKVNGQLVGVGELHRTENGGVWRDQEEEVEYARLLGGNADGTGAGRGDWVQFDEERGVGAFDDGRSVLTQDSDLDPRYAMRAEVDPFDTSDVSSRAKHLRKNAEFPTQGDTSSNGRHRRRPEPLTLVPQHTAHLVRPSNPTEAQIDFFESSFAPSTRPVLPTSNPSSATVDSYGNKKSMLKGLFKSKKSTRA